jgi:spore maturation protein CgeB
MKEIISQMNPGSNVVAAFDSSDLKDAIKRLQGEVAGLSKQSHQNTNDL